MKKLQHVLCQKCLMWGEVDGKTEVEFHPTDHDDDDVVGYHLKYPVERTHGRLHGEVRLSLT